MHRGLRRIELEPQQGDPGWFVALRRGGADLEPAKPAPAGGASVGRDPAPGDADGAGRPPSLNDPNRSPGRSRSRSSPGTGASWMAGRPMLTARSCEFVSRCRPTGWSAARGGLGCRWSTSMPAPGGRARGLSWPRASGLPLGGASPTGSRPPEIRLRLPASLLRWGRRGALIRTPLADFEKCHTAPPSQSGSGAGHALPALAGSGQVPGSTGKPHRIDARTPPVSVDSGG